MLTSELATPGAWDAGATGTLAFSPEALCAAVERVRDTAHVVRDRSTGRVGVAIGGALTGARNGDSVAVLGTLPPLYPEWLGDRSFAEVHRVRFPYVVGEMANGIATTGMVTAAARAGVLGFFGAAGLPLERIARAIAELRNEVGDTTAWGINLIHSPQEPAHEQQVADLCVRRGVLTVSASAFMTLSPAVVYCAVAGLRADPAGRIVRARHIVAKISRPEVAQLFMSPPPDDALRALVARGLVTEDEARLAARIPVAEDITVEADSGGHTDNRPLVVLLPSVLSLRDRIIARSTLARPIRVGAAGGLATPAAVAAAFALGAAYVLTGSINQCTVESGMSRLGKAMLAEADLADVAMAPAADMFELGVKVQVLKRGTLFGARAAKLYDVYVHYESLDAIPGRVRSKLEADVFRSSLADAWELTKQYWSTRDPGEIERASRDPRHQMALTFRSYLGLSTRWAMAGEASRQADFQIWCGPAMGAFNRWTAGSFLADPAERGVAQIALNLLEGAAVVTRAQQFRTSGAPIPAEAFAFNPRRLA